ncbi:ABC transporter substrate-binding protein (plasmid) [Rhizobium leguminosarum]|uniref:ABC transporter substrate-binding protein n=1 Tax=Rhizobium TaxID=379 RepID=UPI001612EB74|nr:MULTISPECIES: sugar ABC transporter substrate-binding protein [Rhizobium]MBB3302457.1 D-xylose transport system substrate-binding protein [Rhizobium sp. BK112]MBB3372130.1 D-xylose transport system substrate-binding protein [Rhizobium sp. BK077]MBB4183282.1 D-xylose transport system substrate-binding protein [Rhizobium sp. BK109]MBY5904248.1 sugar ABC transporter substrate-binding protein [Rhizobium leguminosarum]MBY5911617.1 sugar ABC transporter substrate-binding protein [Rhizobium legumi
MERLIRSLLATTIIAAVAGGVAFGRDKAKVFFLLPNQTTIRFESRDAPFFVAAMKEKAPDVEVVVQNAQGDPNKQQAQVEDAIAQGAKLILLTSADANLAAGGLAAAAKANVPVVLYDHDAVGGKAEAHIVFDSLAVGQAQGKRAAELINAMSKTPVKVARVKGNQGEYGTGQYEKGQNEFLQPLIDSGKVKVVCEQYTQNWDPVLAQNFAEDCLTKNGGDVDVFLGMNDGTTGGSVAALISQGAKPGDKLVTGGQDATVEALRYIAQGWQDNSVLKDLKVQATEAAEVVASIVAGKGVPKELVNGKVNNTFMDVPAVFLPVSNITKDNLGDVVTKGVWTWAEICKGIETTDVCKKNL